MAISVASLTWIRLTAPELARLHFPLTARLNFQFLCFFGGAKGVKFQIPFFKPEKALPWPVRCIMTYWAWGVSNVTRGSGEEAKKNRNFHASNWLFAQTTHIDIAPPPKCCMQGRVWELVIYLKVDENRLRGLGAVGSKITLSHWLGHGLYNSL